jgi:hypothetical protein
MTVEATPFRVSRNALCFEDVGLALGPFHSAQGSFLEAQGPCFISPSRLSLLRGIGYGNSDWFSISREFIETTKRSHHQMESHSRTSHLQVLTTDEFALRQQAQMLESRDVASLEGHLRRNRGRLGKLE